MSSSTWRLPVGQSLVDVSMRTHHKLCGTHNPRDVALWQAHAPWPCACQSRGLHTRSTRLLYNSLPGRCGILFPFSISPLRTGRVFTGAMRLTDASDRAFVKLSVRVPLARRFPSPGTPRPVIGDAPHPPCWSAVRSGRCRPRRHTGVGTVSARSARKFPSGRRHGISQYQRPCCDGCLCRRP